jgi:phosphatidylglycerol:prolipoprotein diacylglycerol transferase
MYPKLSDILNDLMGTHINLPFQTYGFFVALGFAAAGWLLYLELKRRERSGQIFAQEKRIKKGKDAGKIKKVHPYELTSNIILLAAVFGIAGAKLFDILEHLDSFFADPFGVLFSFSGLTFYGGLIVAAVAVCIYAERNRIPWPIIADAVSPGLIMAYGIGRIGCQLSGDGCWGLVNLQPKPEWLAFLPDWLWAFDYPGNVINEGSLMPGCAGDHCYRLDQPVFPTPVYETVMALLIFGVLWLMRKKLAIPGFLFSIYLILNAMERFAIEKIRINIRYPFAGMQVTQAEAVAVVLAALGVAGMFYFRWKHQKSKPGNSL